MREMSLQPSNETQPSTSGKISVGCGEVQSELPDSKAASTKGTSQCELLERNVLLPPASGDSLEIIGKSDGSDHDSGAREDPVPAASVLPGQRKASFGERECCARWKALPRSVFCVSWFECSKGHLSLEPVTDL
jgi:hypothetical protein